MSFTIAETMANMVKELEHVFLRTLVYPFWIHRFDKTIESKTVDTQIQLVSYVGHN